MEELLSRIFSRVGKDWLAFLLVCVTVVFIGYFGFSFFSMTMKVVLLWLFIAFGCGTVAYHLLHPHTTTKPQNTKNRTDSDLQRLYEKRAKAAEKLQRMQNDMVQEYKENILKPREEAKREREEKKFYEFNPIFRGTGHQLGSEDDDGVSCLNSEQLINHIDQIYDEILEDRGTSHPSDDLGVPYPDDEEIEAEQPLEQTSLRQRKTAETPTPEADFSEERLTEMGGKILTLAFKCPNGKTYKKRFSEHANLELVLDYVASLGFSSQRFGLYSSFPRTHLKDKNQSLSDMGIKQDTSLMIDELS